MGRDRRYQHRRRVDRARTTRPPQERAVAAVLGLVGLAAALAAAWWLWSQSSVSALVRDASPNWLPTGDLVFASEDGGQTDLYVTDRSGGQRQVLAATPSNEGDAAFSPDRSRVAFHSDRDGNLEIYVAQANGDAPRRLTNDPGIDRSPAWSSDGSQLVFMSNRANPEFDLFRISADGTGLEQLTSGGSNGYPEYSPDGTQLVFQIGRDTHIMTLGTRGLRRLTREPADGLHPTWSPDGRRIAFASWRNGRGEIFAVKADGSDPRVIVTMPAGDAVDPRWSPDGKYIAFVHVPDGGARHAADAAGPRIVYVVEADTGRLTRISR